MTYWRALNIFGYLADELAKNRVVILTGAGISLNLTSSTGGKLPKWLELLRRLREQAIASAWLKTTELDELNTLLDDKIKPPESAHFLEAAQILSAVWQGDFNKAVALLTTTIANDTTKTHKEITLCEPRAILTYNYDSGHENARKQIFPTNPDYTVIIPSNPNTRVPEAQIRQALVSDNFDNLLVKAHGCISLPTSLVLTRESYRELLARNPAYRAFLSHLFINYTVLAIGFGMDDPDFQDCLDVIGQDVGAAVGHHVFFTAKSPTPNLKDLNAVASYNASEVEQARRDIILRRRYGFEPFYCDDWSDLNPILADLRVQSGPNLLDTIDRCINPHNEERSRAHNELQRLSMSGAQRAANLLKERLEVETNEWRAAEWCYSLGKLRPLQGIAKHALRKVIEKQRGIRRMATAVIAFIEYAEEADLTWLNAQFISWQNSPDPEEGGPLDPERRVRAYFEYAIRKTSAKHAAWNKPDLTP